MTGGTIRTVCYFGTYDRKRPRNRILIEGLQREGIRIIECRFSPWGDVEDKSRIGFWGKVLAGFRFVWGYLVLTIRYLTLGDHDAVIVGYLGHFDILLAKPLTSLRRKPLIFDVFLSLYDTVVEDRRLASPGSPAARFLFRLDRIACRLADRVLLDTQAHIDFFVKTFDLPEEKFRRVFVGAEGGLFYPCSSNPIPDRPFKVLFYGQFIPLHGIETILRAARLLEGEEIVITVIGRGQESARIRKLSGQLAISNIEWVDWVPYRDLHDWICRTHVGLGIFGETEKAGRVIPNKAFQILACRRPLVTGDSPAVRELLRDGESVLLCKRGDPESLARAIRSLKEDPGLRERIAEGGWQVFQERCRVQVSDIL